MTEETPQSEPGMNLYSGEPQHNTFPRMAELFPTGVMAASSMPFQFPDGSLVDLPATYEFDGETRATEDFFTATDTAGLLVLKDGAVRYERYALTGGRDVPWISWSVAKSFVSALVGIAVNEGHIDSIEDPIDRYVPGFMNSAYAGVRIKDVLQMSSGVRWNEDYSDPQSDISRFGAAIAAGGSLENFVAGMVRAEPPGTLCQYNSADTQALGSLLVAATGRTMTDYMQEKLYEPLGMEFDGYWLLDSTGMEMAFGGLNLTARDFAKIGELFRNNGIWQDRRIIPEAWVRASVTADAAHLEPGRVLVGGHVLPLGYGYQWWIPQGSCGEFSAIGVYNQFVYVDPSRGTVIVKQSANRAYGTSQDEADNKEMETIEFLRAIARNLD